MHATLARKSSLRPLVELALHGIEISCILAVGPGALAENVGST